MNIKMTSKLFQCLYHLINLEEENQLLPRYSSEISIRTCKFMHRYRNVNPDLLQTAISTGNLQVLKYLISSGYKGYINRNDMDEAARGGHLEMVKYLHSIRKDGTNNAMDWAAGNGHLEMVKHLHSIGQDGSIYAMIDAAKYGHLDVVKYLYSIGKEPNHRTMDWAAMNGRLEVVKYLSWIQKSCSSHAITKAARYGHLEVVKYLYETGSKITDQEDIINIARNGHLEVLKYCYEIGIDCNIAIEFAINIGHLEMVQFLYQHYPQRFLRNPKWMDDLEIAKRKCQVLEFVLSKT